MRGRLLRNGLVASALCVLGASFPSCSSSSNAASGADAGDDSQAQADSTIVQDSGCDPCVTSCPCAFMDMFFNPGKCQTIVCGPSLQWGGPNFCNGAGCVDAPDESTPCDPCTSQCACLSGFPPRFDPSTCANVSCKDDGTGTMMGTWGPGVFCPGNACDAGLDAARDSGGDAADEAMAPVEASTD